MRTTLRLDLPSIHAVRAVYTALQGIEGIARADVSRRGATIEHDGGATAERLRHAVAQPLGMRSSRSTRNDGD